MAIKSPRKNFGIYAQQAVLYETVLELVKLQTENSILIKKKIVEIDFNYLNTRSIYFLLDSQKISLEEFDLIKQNLFI